jgi:hypothetical protein
VWIIVEDSGMSDGVGEGVLECGEVSEGGESMADEIR